MAYIIAVNPAVLSGAGIDAGALACATCLGAGIMTICMGIFANRPLACASGLGVNAMIAGITTTVCGGDWHVAMSVIFLEASSSCCSCFVACARPSWMPSGCPAPRHLGGSGPVYRHDRPVRRRHHHRWRRYARRPGRHHLPTFIVGIISIVVTVALASRNVPGSLLIGIIVAVIAGIPLGVTHAPTGIIAPLDFSSIGGPIADAGGVLAIVKVLTDPRSSSSRSRCS